MSTPYRYNNYPRVPNFTPFRSMASRFWVPGNFETSASNDLEMTLNIKRSIVPHIRITTTSKSPPQKKITPFRYTASCFRVIGNLETTAWSDPTMTLSNKRSNVFHIIYTAPESRNFTHVFFKASCFRVTDHLETNSPYDLKMILKGTPYLY